MSALISLRLFTQNRKRAATPHRFLRYPDVTRRARRWMKFVRTSRKPPRVGSRSLTKTDLLATRPGTLRENQLGPAHVAASSNNAVGPSVQLQVSPHGLQ